MGTPSEGQKNQIFTPALFLPLEVLGVKLKITEDTFKEGKDAFGVYRDKDYLDYYLKKLGVSENTSHKDYLLALLQISYKWGLIDQANLKKETERLSGVVEATTKEDLNKKLGFDRIVNLKSKITNDTKQIAEVISSNNSSISKPFTPIRDIVNILPDGEIKDLSKRYIDFRDLSNKDQWRVVGRGALKGAQKVSGVAGEKLQNFAIFARKEFWDDIGFAVAYGRGKNWVSEKVVEPVKKATDEKITEPVKQFSEQNIIQPSNIAGGFFNDLDAQTRAFHKTGVFPENWDNANRALSKAGIIRPTEEEPKISIFAGKGYVKKKQEQGELNLISFIVTNALKSVIAPIRFAFKTVKPLVQATEWGKERISALKGWASNVARPFMSEKFEGLRLGIDKVSSVVRAGYNFTSNVAGALGNAALPTALALGFGGPVPAILVGTASLSTNLASRYLNASITPSQAFQRAQIYKYGSYAGREQALLQNIKTNPMSANWFKNLSADELEDLTKHIKLRSVEMGGSSKVFMGTRALNTFSLGVSIGIALGFGPAGVVTLGLLSAGAHFGSSYLFNKFVTSPQYLRMANLGLSKMPVNQILGVFFGGKWIQDQFNKWRANPDRFAKEEWGDFALSGGLGNAITGASTITSGLSVGRWALDSANAIGKSVGLQGVRVAQGMAIGGALGSVAGSLAGYLWFGVTPGVGAIVGGFVGSVVGGLVGAALTTATGGAAFPAIGAGSFAGGFLGSFLGTGIDYLFDAAKRAADAIAGFLGLLSLAKFIATLASLFTAPLKKLSDYVDLVAPLVLGLIAITTVSVISSQTAINTPVSSPSGQGSTQTESVLASIINPIISDFSIGTRIEKLKLPASTTLSVSSCYSEENSDYYYKNEGEFTKQKRNHGLTLSDSQNTKILSPLNATVEYNGQSPFYIKSSLGEYINSGENVLILAPDKLTASYYIVYEGINSDFNVGQSIDEKTLLGSTTGNNFRITVINKLEKNNNFNPINSLNPCTEDLNTEFPGFDCAIIPQFDELCVNE